MCSNGCDCDQVAKDLDSALNLSEHGLKPCRKCGGEPFIIMDGVHVECKNCFLESCNKTVRSTIGRSKLIRNNDSVLIAYSGGPSSCALLDLMWNSIKGQSRREQKFRPSILHIDMQASFSKASDSSLEQRVTNLNSTLKYLSESYQGWPIYWSTIETCVLESDEAPLFAIYSPDCGITADSHLLKDESLSSRLSNILNDISDLTSRQQSLTDRTYEFISRLACKINQDKKPDEAFRYVFSASSATQLANNLLVDVILGRGSTICSAVSVCDKRTQVPLMRPMRDFSKKEVAFYLRAKGMEAKIQPTNLLSMQPFKASIQTVTENFLSKLYADYPSTYSTLLRTGSKMQD